VALAPADDDSYLSLVDRMKNMSSRGGEDAEPQEIEESLYGHREGRRPRPRTSVIIAGARLPATRCCATSAWLRRPRVVEACPTTVTGKVQKFPIREDSVKALSREEPP